MANSQYDRNAAKVRLARRVHKKKEFPDVGKLLTDLGNAQPSCGDVSSMPSSSRVKSNRMWKRHLSNLDTSSGSKRIGDDTEDAR
jgi:hypothetical protein